MEIWKDIKGFEGLYQVSNFGKVKSLDKMVNCRGNKKRIIKGKIKVPIFNATNGYYQIGLTKNGIRTTHYIHRLVAINFLDNENDLKEVNHIDENKKNNNVDNLEWCDRIYNENYGTKRERVLKKLSYKVLQLSLDDEVINTFNSISEAERSLGIYNIGKCLKGICKQAGGYRWKRAS